jgi:hypothetical protein
MRDKYGTTFLLVHHTTKQGESEWGRSKLWGSQFLNAWSETLWHIRRPGDELFNLIKRTFKLSGPLPPIRIDFDIDDAAYRYSAVPSIVSKEEAERLVKAPHQTKDPSLSKRILQALTLAEDGLSTQELSDELDVTTHQIETSTKKLTQKGDISLDALGKWRSAVPHLG